MFAFGKRNATTTTTTRLSSITDQDNLSRSYSTTSTAVPPSLFSNDGASILTELPDYADIYVRGRQPAIGLATNFAFPRATNMSLVQDWTKSNVDWDLFFYETTNMILRIEGKVYTLRHQVGMCIFFKFRFKILLGWVVLGDYAAMWLHCFFVYV